MLRKLLLCTALLATTGCPNAFGRTLVEMDLIDRDTGQWLPETPFRGDTWVPGVPGHRYSIRLTNTTGQRVLVVLSVDGVNAVTGQTADPAQAGYVLDPWESTEIAGWRKSMDEVAQFVFTDLPDSYAARTGRPRNVGVVGMAVFREQRPVAYAPPYSPPYSPPPSIAREEAASGAARDAAPAAQAKSAESSQSRAGPSRQQLGTGHGQREWSQVSHTDFVRATRRPSQVTELRYDDEDTLVAMGVLPRPYRDPYRWAQAPRAFPDGFVADP